MTIAATWLPEWEHRSIDDGSGGTYTGGPAKVVWHTYETDPGRIEVCHRQQSGRSSGVYHVLADPGARRVIQQLPLNIAASALRNGPHPVQTNRDSAVQVCIIGRAGNMHLLSEDDLMWLGHAVLAPIKRAVPQIDINRFPRFWGAGEGIVLATKNAPQRMSTWEWDNFNGQCGHQHVPDDNDHWDPGALNVARITEHANYILNPPPPPSYPPPPPAPDKLVPGQILWPEQRLASANGQFQLVMQTDGNLVLYDADLRALWSSGTNHTPGAWAAMQSDGNFVIYNGEGTTALWQTGTDGQYDAFLVLQDDGNLVVYNAQRIPVWDTGTWGGRVAPAPVLAQPRVSRVTLRATMRHSDAAVFQSALNHLSGTNLAVDGIYGAASAQACRNWQRFFGLAADGVCGPATWESIYGIADFVGYRVGS